MSNPTIVSASLDDKELKQSIANLVAHVKRGLHTMLTDTNSTVDEMERKLKSLGNVKIDTVGTADGGSSIRARKHQEETQAVKETTSAHKELVMTLDKEAAAIQKASGRKKGIDYISLPSDVDKSVTYLINANKDVDTQMEAILRRESALVAEKQKETQATEQAAQATRMSGEELRKIYDEQKKINEEINKRANGIRTDGTTPFQSYDNLRQSIAAVLGIQEQQVKMADIEKNSYNRLSLSLKQLNQAYDALGRSDRESEKGKELVVQIQILEREIQKLRAQASRPISLLDVKELNEKTLDDIAYKMRQLSSYRSGLNVETQKKEISTVNAEYDRLKKRMDEVMQKNQSMIASNNALGRSWNYMKNRLAFYFTVGASTSFIKNLIEVRSQYEMNERALGILINSAERGTQIFNELSQMALVSPYTLIELSAAAKQLTAYDIAAKDVVDTTRRLADMASAVGIPIERLTYALGQIKAYGYLNSRDARMFANAGIPLVKQLSDYYTELEGKMVSTADVYDRMKKKAIDYNSVMSVVTKMTDEGGKFFDFQAKMADTLKVRLANLTLAWNNMLNDMGKESQGVLTWGIGALRQLFLHWKQLDALIKDAAWILGIRTGFMLIAYAALKAGGALGITTRQMALSSVVGTKLAGVLGTLGRSLATIVKSPLTWWSLLALAAWDIFDAFVNANKATEDFNKSLRDSAKTTYDDLKKFAEQYKNIRDSLYKTETIKNSGGKETTIATPQNIDESEAKKVWEAMREQIELSSHASDEYISKLLSIENVSERLRQGFQIIDNIQAVSAALKEVGDDGIKVVQGWSAWWNAYLLPDGLIGNIKDVANAEKELIENFGSIEAARKRGSKLYSDYEKRELENFRKDLKVTTDSVLNFINLNGWSGDTDKIDEVFKQVTDKLATQGNLDPQTAFTLQREVEVARSKAAKEALEIRISDEKKALATASDEISKQQIKKNLETLEQQKRDFDKFNGENRAYWNDFTKYIKERHISELTAAYNSMTDHGKKAMDFQSEEWQKRVHDWANRYEKSHNLATDSVFNRLRNWINDANTWSVFIKMTISNEDGKSVYEQLEEYDKAADDAWKTMQRLDKRISQLRKKGAKEVEGYETGAMYLSRVSADDKELTEALKERTQAQKEYNDAIAKGGESKKENTATTKAQKAAESELQKALKDELQLIDKVRSQYKKLTNAGARSGEALADVTNQFANSLKHVNSVLGKNGIPLFDISKFAGTDNPNALLDMLKLQLDSAKVAKNIKPEEIKELEVKYSEIIVDAKAYNLTKITNGLNKELDRLKEERELAIALDADPELGSIFANYMGINLEDLPKTAEEAAKKAKEYIDKILSENNSSEKIDILSLMDKKAFDSWVESRGHNLEDGLVKAISAFRGYLHKVNVDETKNQAQEWNKLLEKYAEYEYKVTHIQKEAEREREVARKKGASQDVFDAINNRERQEIARVGFEKFQKSPEWIAATGDLANMSKSAIGMLIEELERYKRTAKNLSPKEIKQLNNALSKLYKEQRKNNPFKAVSNMLDEANERMSIFDEEIEETQEQIDKLSKKHKTNLIDGIADNDTQKKLKEAKERLEKLKEERDDIGKIDASTWVSSINETISAVKSAIEVFDGLAKAIGGVENSDVDKVFSILDSAGKGASTGAAFGGYGAIIGGVVGAAAGVVNAFADVWSGNERINKSIEVSTQKVRALEREYKRLERAVDDAYGTDAIGAQRLMMLNKEAELAELERQLELEKSRKAKNKDQEKIDELRDKVEELRYEVNNAAREIILDLLEIGDAQDWANDFVNGMIDAFRDGENYMKSYEDAFREMVDNMIAKTIAGKVIGERIEQMVANIKEIAKARADSDPDVVAAMEALKAEERGRDVLYAFRKGGENVPEEAFDIANRRIKEAQDIYNELYTKAVEITPDDVKGIRDSISSWKDDVKREFDTYMEAFGVEFGSAKDSQQLSALQQGIQGITEDTAGALEAITNGISQQSYLQSDLLTQIRDAIVGFETDIQLDILSGILLQLQSSYQTQQAIQSILEGWSSPDGLSVRVEMK